ncbi:hypothetical protein B0F90DRAFT_1652723 [Multifurca ochricompacta]|uniref:Uncharacterized protein n=1 Tax=Multifurca ochricompacta TaxID=376703 RepID=A0AAD4LUG2_9AGAM|nr:hypothetical protein B0F90DRAFT_1652723 [Multifurca ochricompacta]
MLQYINTEMAIFWNTHGRITSVVAQAHIGELLGISPPPAPTDTTITRAPLDTPDELALRALLLGIMHRAVGHPAEARGFLRDAHARHAKIPSTGSTWIGGVALFELAVLELREAQRSDYEDEAEAEAEKDTNSPSRWVKVLKEAGSLLDSAVNLSGSEVDLSSRLESRIAMLRDEIGLKRELLGIGAGR